MFFYVLSAVAAAGEIGVIKNFLYSLPEKALDLALRVVLAVIAFLIGIQIIKIVRKLVKKSMTKAEAEIGAIQFVDSFVKMAMYIVLVLLLATSFGVDAASIVAVIGSAGVAIGLALQGSLSNLAGGVLIMVLQPFKVGDYIMESATGKEGSVCEIHIFYTKLLTPDNKTVILPNGALANTSIVNVTTRENRRMDIKISISYHADLKRAKEALTEVLETDEAVLKSMDMSVFVAELGASGVILNVRCWFKQADYWTGMARVMENCKLKLDENQIEIPFNQLDVHLNGIENRRES